MLCELGPDYCSTVPWQFTGYRFLFDIVSRLSGILGGPPVSSCPFSHIHASSFLVMLLKGGFPTILIAEILLDGNLFEYFVLATNIHLIVQDISSRQSNLSE